MVGEPDGGAHSMIPTPFPFLPLLSTITRATRDIPAASREAPFALHKETFSISIILSTDTHHIYVFSPFPDSPWH